MPCRGLTILRGRLLFPLTDRPTKATVILITDTHPYQRKKSERHCLLRIRRCTRSGSTSLPSSTVRSRDLYVASRQRALVQFVADESDIVAHAYWARAGVRPKLVFRTSSLEAVRVMAAMGAAVTVLAQDRLSSMVSRWVGSGVPAPGRKLPTRILGLSGRGEDAWRSRGSLFLKTCADPRAHESASRRAMPRQPVPEVRAASSGHGLLDRGRRSAPVVEKRPRIDRLHVGCTLPNVRLHREVVWTAGAP